MRKLVNYRQYYRINGGEWIDTSIRNHIRYLEEEETKTWQSKEFSFEEAVRVIDEGILYNCSSDRTLIFNKLFICLPSENFMSSNIRYYEKEVKSFEIKEVYEPYSSTIKTLADLLPAEEFCLWLKDQGITQITNL